MHKIPAYRDLASLYLDGMTKQEIMQMYQADAPQGDLRGRKLASKNKINNFFKVIDESRKTYVEQPKARSSRAVLIFYANKKTLISTVSYMRVLEELEKKGWNLQEVVRDTKI